MFDYIFLQPELTNLQTVSQFYFDYYKDHYKGFMEAWFANEKQKPASENRLFNDDFLAEANKAFIAAQEKQFKKVVIKHNALFDTNESVLTLADQVAAHTQAKTFVAMKMKRVLKKNPAFIKKAGNNY